MDDFKHQLVFTYGSLKRGFVNNVVLKDSVFVTEAYTRRTDFRMFGLVKGASFNFPIVLHRGEGIERKTEAAIHGEVFAVDTETLMKIDTIEQNGKMYERKLVQVSNPEYNGNKSFQAWMYIGVEDFWYKHKKSIALCGRNEEFQLYQWTKEHQFANINP
jgi:gamma-glutamylaminecyclotransferase